MFKLQPNPTFKTKVQISVPGQKRPGEIECEFKHFTASAWESLSQEKSVRDALAEDVLIGWSGVDEPFSREAVELLFDKYPASAMEIFQAFAEEMFGGKAKQKN